MTTRTRMTLTHLLRAATCDAPVCHNRLDPKARETQVQVDAMPDGRTQITAFCSPVCKAAA